MCPKRVQFKTVWQEMTCFVQEERTRDLVAANGVMLDRQWLPKRGGMPTARAKNGLGEHWLANTTQTFHCDTWEVRILPGQRRVLPKPTKEHTCCVTIACQVFLFNAANLLISVHLTYFKDLISFCFNRTPSSILLYVLKQIAMATNQQILMNVPYCLRQVCYSAAAGAEWNKPQT